jgi:hypothetical protein
MRRRVDVRRDVKLSTHLLPIVVENFTDKPETERLMSHAGQPMCHTIVCVRHSRHAPPLASCAVASSAAEMPTKIHKCPRAAGAPLHVVILTVNKSTVSSYDLDPPCMFLFLFGDRLFTIRTSPATQLMRILASQREFLRACVRASARTAAATGAFGIIELAK